MMGAAGRGFRGRGGGGFRGRGVVGGRFGGRGGRPEPTGPRDPRSLVSYVDVDAPKVNLLGGALQYQGVGRVEVFHCWPALERGAEKFHDAMLLL